MTMDRGCGFLWRYWVARLMPMPHKQVSSAWPIQLLQLTAWARGRCTRAGHKCWVMLEIQKYSNIYGQHESNTQATGHSTVAKTGLRIPRTDAWIAPQSDSGIGICLKYIPISLVRSVQSPVRRYMLRSAYVSGVRRVASHVRSERAGQKLCTTAIMRLQDTKLVCVYLCICLFVGTFRHWGLPKPVEWRLLNDFGKDPMPLTDIVCATQPQIGAFSQYVKNNDD